MAEIRRFPFTRHLRAEPSNHILSYRNGKLKRSGRGLAFWFMPLGAAIAEIPVDDRDQDFIFNGRTADFQLVHVQGVVTFRVRDAERVADRVDFTIDLTNGTHRRQPLDQLSVLLTGIAKRIALAHIALLGVRELLTKGLKELQNAIAEGLENDPGLQALGIEVVAARVYDLKPTAELEKALQTPTREALQQNADEAMFQRRALAVEKERAIEENELQTRIELAKREQLLITQRGQNMRQEAEEAAEEKRIEAEAQAERMRLGTTVRAEQIRVVEGARAETEKARLDAYRDVPLDVLAGMALQQLPDKLNVEHLSLTPELLGPVFQRLVDAGTRKLEQ